MRSSVASRLEGDVAQGGSSTVAAPGTSIPAVCFVESKDGARVLVVIYQKPREPWRAAVALGVKPSAFSGWEAVYEAAPEALTPRESKPLSGEPLGSEPLSILLSFAEEYTETVQAMWAASAASSLEMSIAPRSGASGLVLLCDIAEPTSFAEKLRIAGHEALSSDQINAIAEAVTELPLPATISAVLN